MCVQLGARSSRGVSIRVISSCTVEIRAPNGNAPTPERRGLSLRLRGAPQRAACQYRTGCAPQKCHPAWVGPYFNGFSVSADPFSASCSSLRERRRRLKLERVFVVQPAQHGCRSHERTRCPSTSRFSLPGSCRSCGRARYAGTQRAVRAPAVVVGNPLAQDRAQMRLGQRNHPIQALAPDRADDPLADRVRLGARER